MLESINTGAILIRDSTRIPGALPFERESYMRGWQKVTTLDGCALERKINEAGWNFFYLANEIRAIVFGSDRHKRVRRALMRIVSRLDMEKFNALEITRVASKRFVGMPYVRVSAHPRHIQESLVIFEARDDRNSSPSKVDHRSDPSAAFAVVTQSG